MNTKFTSATEYAMLVAAMDDGMLTAMLVNINEFVVMNERAGNSIDPSILQSIVDIALKPDSQFYIVGWGVLEDVDYWATTIEDMTLSSTDKSNLKDYVMSVVMDLLRV